jgi:hypothetical protein
MLEDGKRLRTWELDAIPTPGAPASAVPLPDHRLDFLTYEGPISGDRGCVRRCDCGTYEEVRESQFELVIRLAGQKLQGCLHLRPGLAGEAGHWQATFESS